MARRQHSDQFKAEALAALDANGGNVRRTAAQVGVSPNTLRDWREGRGVNPEVTDLRSEKKQDLADRLEAIAHKALDGLLEQPEDYFGSFKDRLTGVGIAIDKVRILRGQGEGATDGLDTFLKSLEGADVE